MWSGIIKYIHMKNLATKHAAADNKADCQLVITDAATEPKNPGKDIADAIKHSAHVAKCDAVKIGADLKAATKAMVKDGKDACACSEKAVLKTTEKALKATSLATAKAAKSVHKAGESK
jgi:hypothetical protein